MKSETRVGVRCALTALCAASILPTAYADIDTGGFATDIDSGGFKGKTRRLSVIADDIDTGGVAAFSFDIDSGGVAATSFDIDSGGVRGLLRSGVCSAAITDDIDTGGIRLLSATTFDIDSGGFRKLSAADIDSGGIKTIAAADIDSGGFKSLRAVADIDTGGFATDIDSGGFKGKTREVSVITDDIDTGGVAAVSFDIDSGGVAATSFDIDSGGRPLASSGCGATFSTDIDSGGFHVLSGPISSIDISSMTIHSLGQAISVTSEEISRLVVGDYVAVFGDVTGPGTLVADQVNRYPSSYVPGSSTVFVAGLVSKVDRRTGRLSLGGLDVDYSATLSNADHPQAGLTLIRGTQPNIGGLVLVD